MEHHPDGAYKPERTNPWEVVDGALNPEEALMAKEKATEEDEGDDIGLEDAEWRTFVREQLAQMEGTGGRGWTQQLSDAELDKLRKYIEDEDGFIVGVEDDALPLMDNEGTRGDVTDDLIERFTKAELEELRKQWTAKHWFSTKSLYPHGKRGSEHPGKHQKGGKTIRGDQD